VRLGFWCEFLRLVTGAEMGQSLAVGGVWSHILFPVGAGTVSSPSRKGQILEVGRWGRAGALTQVLRWGGGRGRLEEASCKKSWVSVLREGAEGHLPNRDTG
jgi:hypothetical protein